MPGFGLSFPALALRRGPAPAPWIADFTAGALPGGLSLARAGAGSRVTAEGRIAMVGPDLPRFDHDPVTLAPRGLLVEPASTNLLAHSAGGSAGWSVSGATLAPLALDALGLFPGLSIASTGANWHRAMQNVAVTAGQSYAVTVWVRAGSSGKATVLLKHNLAGTQSVIEGSLGALAVVSQAAGALAGLGQQLLADGLTWRITLRFSSNATGALSLGIGPFATVAGQTLVLLAAQVEPGEAAGSYIASAGSPGQRAADLPAIAGVAGRHRVTVTLGDGTVLALPEEVVGPGYWPAAARSAVRALRLERA